MGLLDFLIRREPAAELDQSEEPAAPVAASRRERAADAGSAVIAEALGAKVLHGWLQNRHQTLMPLTLNLSVMAEDQQARLARILASLLLAGRPADAAAELGPTLRSWLSGLGAGHATVAAFDQAMDDPLPLNVIFEIAQRNELTIYTYVAALVASDTRFPVSTMLCDVVQTRFDLPAALVRSAVRRYRR